MIDKLIQVQTRSQVQQCWEVRYHPRILVIGSGIFLFCLFQAEFICYFYVRKIRGANNYIKITRVFRQWHMPGGSSEAMGATKWGKNSKRFFIVGKMFS